MKQILGMKKMRVCKRRPQQNDNQMAGSEVMCGHLLLLQNRGQRTVKCPVFVKVYRNCFEHYAVIYKDQKFSNISTYVNLKNCVVMYNENCKNQLRVVPHSMEGSVIVFETQETETVLAWKCAFEDSDCSQAAKSISTNLSPVIPRSPAMPTLEEALEEE